MEAEFQNFICNEVLLQHIGLEHGPLTTPVHIPFSETNKSIKKHIESLCDGCKKKNALYACSCCRVAIYCSDECAERDWKARHATYCEKFATLIPQEAIEKIGRRFFRGRQYSYYPSLYEWRRRWLWGVGMVESVFLLLKTK